jgi:LysM repeat protein
MGKSLKAVGLFCAILLFLFTQAHAVPASHEDRSGEAPKKVSKKPRVSAEKKKVSSKLSRTGTKSNQKLVADQEITKTRSSKARRHTTRLAKKSRVPAIEEVTTEKNDNNEYIEYKVRRGDTLDKLAKRFNIDKEEIVDLNNFKKKRLSPGMMVFIPKEEENTDEAPVVLNDRPSKPWRNEEERGILVKVAKSFAGAPYRYGGESVRGLDCSAFVKKMYEIFEVQLPRSAREQYYAGPRINKEDLTTGDLVFFKTKRFVNYPTHVGIYIGDDKFIHASSLLKRGVKVDCLSDGYFTRTYMGAIRVKEPPSAERKTETDPNQHKAPSNT